MTQVRTLRQQAATERSDVLDIVRQHPEGITTRGISKALEQPHYEVRDRVNWLKKKGLLVSKRAKDRRTHVWFIPNTAHHA
jgi:DNA-binding IclR family transcriptional regulator